VLSLCKETGPAAQYFAGPCHAQRRVSGARPQSPATPNTAARGMSWRARPMRASSAFVMRVSWK